MLFRYLFVPKSIMSVLPYRGVWDFTKWRMKLTLILTFKYQVFDGTKKLPLFVTIAAGWVGHDISGQLSLLTSSQFRGGR